METRSVESFSQIVQSFVTFDLVNGTDMHGSVWFGCRSDAE